MRPIRMRMVGQSSSTIRLWTTVDEELCAAVNQSMSVREASVAGKK